MSKDEKSDDPKARPTRVGDGPLIQPKKSGLWGGLWSSFLAGMVVIAPIGITVAIVWWFLTGPMARLDGFVKRTLPDGGSSIETLLQVFPGVGVFIAFIALVMLGTVTKNFVGRSLIRAGERIVDSVPVVRNLYRFFKNVFETALQQSDRSFKEVALVEYPRPGAWAMAFVVGNAKGEVLAKLHDQGEDLNALFVPTVPNPTSGFLLFVPRKDMRVLSMSVEEAAKVVFSMGLVVPDYLDPDQAVKKLEEVAEAVQQESLKKRLFKIGKS